MLSLKVNLSFHLGRPMTPFLWEPTLQHDQLSLESEAVCLKLKVVCHPSLPGLLGSRISQDAQFGEEDWFDLNLAAWSRGTGGAAGQRQARFGSQEPVSALGLTPCVFFIWPGHHFPRVFPPAQRSRILASMATCMLFSLGLLCPNLSLFPGMPEAAFASAAGWFRCKTGGDL